MTKSRGAANLTLDRILRSNPEEADQFTQAPTPLSRTKKRRLAGFGRMKSIPEYPVNLPRLGTQGLEVPTQTREFWEFWKNLPIRNVQDPVEWAKAGKKAEESLIPALRGQKLPEGFGGADVLSPKGLMSGALFVAGMAGGVGAGGGKLPAKAAEDPLFTEAVDDLINKILPAQKAARKATTELYKEARKPAFEKVEEILATPSGEETVKKATEQLAIGRLPRGEFDTEAIQAIMTQPKKDAIFNNLATNPNLPKGSDRTNAMVAVQRILSPERYIVDHPGLALTIPPNTPFRPFEMKLLEKAWGAEKAKKIAQAMAKLAREPVKIDKAARDYLMTLPDNEFKQLSMLPTTNRAKVLATLEAAGMNAIDALGIPKALKFSFDLSIPFRQGALLGARHPLSWLKMWRPMVKALRSDEIALKLQNELLIDPEIMQTIKELGLDLYGVKKGLKYYQRPEQMASRFAEKYIPGIRQSARAAAVGMNYLMTGVGKTTYRIMKRMGSTDDEMRAMGSLINELAGRGELPKALQGTAGDILNKLLTSPRYVASRFEWPTKLFSSSKAVRQEAASTLVAWALLGTTILGVARAAGVRIEFDPRSSDAYKLRIGHKRLDIWVGYAQIIRLLAQLSTGQRKNTETGEITSISRGQVLGRFLESKEAPGIGALSTLATLQEGRVTTYTGEKLDLRTLKGIGGFVKESITPAAIEEIVDAYVLEGSQSAMLSGLGLAGVGVSTYAPQEKKTSLPSGGIVPSKRQGSKGKSRTQKRRLQGFGK